MTNQWDTYAELLDSRIGSGGDALHTKLIHPLITSYMNDIVGKTIIDLGCGNGYIAGLLPGFGTYIGIDSSQDLLKRANERYGKLPNVVFLQSDISNPLEEFQGRADIVLCNMVLQYVPDLRAVVNTIHSLLKPDGICAVIVDHPDHLLFVHAQELAGKKQEKFLDSQSYFIEGERKKKSLWGKAVLSYYHRKTSTYINTFSTSMILDRIDEVSEDMEMPRILGMKWRNHG